jgi:hypothetical protein
MNCYICETIPGPGGTHYHVKAAVGICHNCGIALCLEHSLKASEPGSPLSCVECAQSYLPEKDARHANHAHMG